MRVVANAIPAKDVLARRALYACAALGFLMVPLSITNPNHTPLTILAIACAGFTAGVTAVTALMSKTQDESPAAPTPKVRKGERLMILPADFIERSPETIFTLVTLLSKQEGWQSEHARIVSRGLIVIGRYLRYQLQRAELEKADPAMDPDVPRAIHLIAHMLPAYKALALGDTPQMAVERVQGLSPPAAIEAGYAVLEEIIGNAFLPEDPMAKRLATMPPERFDRLLPGLRDVASH
ncbi:MAG TPA: hypothetical protein VHE37_15370 [Nevskiaceae bacterium]|nr:hypothetical protein [Nevskiaceae bacterium]